MDKDELCPNLQNHGKCHFINTGCRFKHISPDGKEIPKMSKLSLKESTNGGLQPSLLARPPPTSSSSTNSIPSSSSNNTESKKRYNFAKVSSFVPLNSGQSPVLGNATISASAPTSTSKNISAAPFTPSGDFEPNGGYMGSPVLNSSYTSINDQTPQLHNGLFIPPQQNQQQPQSQPQSQQPQPNLGDVHGAFAPPGNSNIAPGPPGGPSQAGPGQDFYYHQHAAAQMQNPFNVLNYHLYAPAPPPGNNSRLHGNEENCETMFIPSKLREKLMRKNEATLKVFPGAQHVVVNGYFDLVPLDTLSLNNQGNQQYYHGYKSSLFKCISNADGKYYTLRRLENIGNNIKEKDLTAAIPWKRLKQNSYVTQVLDAFTTRAFGDHSLVMVYDFYPNSKTLDEFHRNPKTGSPTPVTESHLWSYIVQLSCGIAAVHEANLGVRSIGLKKVIVTSDNRVRLSDCGILDILESSYDNEKEDERLETLQEQDLTKLGSLILALAKFQKGISTQSPEADLAFLETSSYHEDFKSAVRYLLTPSDCKSVFEFHKLISARLVKELNSSQTTQDYYESQLTREVENARLVRLLTKINFILHRPSPVTPDPTWAPTGEKYALSLFHSYVFHQVDEHGKPVLDLSHVLRCLNKLDCGIDEKMLLVSGDEQSCLMLSYKEVKSLIERCYRELCS